jgi:RimJ/RimL family protein N-acetyltransferase
VSALICQSGAVRAQEVTRRCSFATVRLDVGEWHAMAEHHDLDLAAQVAMVLTATTTRSLPAEWQGDFTVERAQGWISARDTESATLLAVDRASDATVGLVILFEPLAEDPTGVDLRLGYVLAESTWGRGLASELVEGLVVWSRSQRSIRSISAGVAVHNPASVRVLRKNGFARSAETANGEQIYELRVGT